MVDSAVKVYAVISGTFTSVQQIMTTVFGGFAAIMHQAALELFFVSIVVGLGFILFAISRALTQGGGAVFETIAFRIFILAGLTAFVEGFPAFGQAIKTDITAFAAHLAGTNPYASGDFTPAGILATNNALEVKLYQSGQGSPFDLISLMNTWKAISIAFVQIGGAILAVDLLLANVSMDIIFGVCAFLVGLIANPWLSSFTTDFFKLIVSTGVFVVLIGAFVAVGQAVVGLEIGVLPGGTAPTVAGPDMIGIGVTSLLFAILASVIPAWVASKIGGNPLLQLGSVLSSVRSGRASVGL